MSRRATEFKESTFPSSYPHLTASEISMNIRCDFQDAFCFNKYERNAETSLWGSNKIFFPCIEL